MKDVIYKWKSDKVTVEKKHIAQFDMTHAQQDSSVMSFVSGQWFLIIVPWNDLDSICYIVLIKSSRKKSVRQNIGVRNSQLSNLEDEGI